MPLWPKLYVAICRACWRIISFISSIPVLKVSGHKSSLANLFVVYTFMSVNPSCIYSGLALVRYLGVDFIFDPALEFILSCCFQVTIKRGNHYVFFITKGMFIITCWLNFTCFPFSYSMLKI